MSPASESSQDHSSGALLKHRDWLDLAGDDFEDEWHPDSGFDRIRAYQSALLFELVQRDYQLRQMHGAPLLPDDYAQEFPQLRRSDGSFPSELFREKEGS